MGIIKRDRYKRGSWNVISDQDGQKRKIQDMRMQWDGLLVGKEEFDPKHPQLEIRARPDQPSRYPVRNTEPGNLVIVPPYVPGEVNLYAIVLDSNSNPYQISNVVLDSDGVAYTVSANVLDSNGVAYTLFTQPPSPMI